ncbi:MAG TPA: hypothetical protein VMT95_01380 [Candidatus Binatia bacterium]|nr:hypothetical protein [Candidatus Binatia bacterium]
MQRQPFKPPEYGTYINYQRVFCQKARDSDIEQFLSDIPLDQALRFFCGVGIMVSNFQGSSFFDFQKGVVRELSAGNPYATRIVDMLVPQNTFITAEQMAVLQKFAIQYCKPEGSPLPSDFTDRLLRVMLAYNSLRGLEGVDLTDTKSAALTVELRNTFSTKENVAFLIDLYWRFFKWAQTDVAKANKHYLDANADFAQFYGLTYPEYAAAAFMFFSYYQQIYSVADLQRYNPFLDIDTFFKPLSNQEPARKWLALNTMPIDDAKAQFEGRSTLRYSGLSLEALLERPFISVQPNVIFPPHPPFLENKIGGGLFFALLDGYNKADGGDRTRSKRFTQFFADFFEQRCVDMAKKAHRTPQFVFGEQPYGKGSKSTDLVIIEGENAVFIDIATARLTMKTTLVELDRDSITKDIRKIVGNAKQMTGAIAAFRSGKFVYRDDDGNTIDPGRLKRIYPAALIIASVPRFFAFNKMIFDAIKAEGYLHGCEQFELFSAEDFDLLMRLCRAGCLVSDVLARKLNQPVPWITMSSFKNYLAIYDHPLRDRANSVQWPGLGEVWYDEIITTTRSWGLSA